MMDSELLKKLICINCRKSALCEVGEILVCQTCGQSISLYEGIPDFRSSRCANEKDWINSDPYAYELTISKTQPYRLKRIDEPLLQYVQGEVLEIGCGTCRLAKPIEERNGKYFGLDPVISFLLYAHTQRKLSRLVLGQGERLPFQNNSFDYIISGFYAYRYVNPELGLPEAHRVLKKGGKFAFDLLNHWILKLIQFKNLLKNKEGCRKPKSSDSDFRSDDVFDFINLTQLKRKAAVAGFTIENIMSVPISPLLPRLNKYLSHLYFHSAKNIYLGYDVIATLKAI